MSKLSTALQASQPSLSRLRSGGGGMGYRAATTQAEGVRPSLLDSVMRFAKAGADMYQARSNANVTLRMNAPTRLSVSCPLSNAVKP